MANDTLKKIVHSLRKNKRGLLGCLVILFILFVTIFAPLISSHNPTEQNLKFKLVSPSLNLQSSHWFGTDHMGRDIASRIFYGTRITMGIGIFAVLIASIIGITIGLIGGYYKGIIDIVFMRIADIQLSFPFILLIISIVAVLGPNTKNVMLVLGISGWVSFARIVRSEVLSLREREFITAARALGCRDFKIIFFHLFPNVGATCIVVGTFEIGKMILMESGLSFLGLGVQPPSISWGSMLADARPYIFTSWWPATFPGLALLVTIMGINLTGDWLRDFLLGGSTGEGR